MRLDTFLCDFWRDGGCIASAAIIGAIALLIAPFEIHTAFFVLALSTPFTWKACRYDYEEFLRVRDQLAAQLEARL